MVLGVQKGEMGRALRCSKLNVITLHVCASLPSANYPQNIAYDAYV
jgi:hypothetical protein